MKLNFTRREDPGTDEEIQVPWWVFLTLTALVLATVIILALNTLAPLVLIGESIAAVLLAIAALVKALRGEG